LAAAIAIGSLLLGAAPAEAAPADVITCSIQVQHAHGSTHVTGTVNVVSTVTCTGTVQVISQQTALYKVGGSSWWGNTNTQANVSSLQTNASTSCAQSPGAFYGAAVTTITFPRGYTPNPQHTDAYGATTNVVCGGGNIATPDGSAQDTGGDVVAVITATRTS
jgi:hypothetical protein